MSQSNGTPARRSYLEKLTFAPNMEVPVFNQNRPAQPEEPSDSSITTTHFERSVSSNRNFSWDGPRNQDRAIPPSTESAMSNASYPDRYLGGRRDDRHEDRRQRHENNYHHDQDYRRSVHRGNYRGDGHQDRDYRNHGHYDSRNRDSRQSNLLPRESPQVPHQRGARAYSTHAQSSSYASQWIKPFQKGSGGYQPHPEAPHEDAHQQNHSLPSSSRSDYRRPTRTRWDVSHDGHSSSTSPSWHRTPGRPQFHNQAAPSDTLNHGRTPVAPTARVQPCRPQERWLHNDSRTPGYQESEHPKIPTGDPRRVQWHGRVPLLPTPRRDDASSSENPAHTMKESVLQQPGAGTTTGLADLNPSQAAKLRTVLDGIEELKNSMTLDESIVSQIISQLRNSRGPKEDVEPAATQDVAEPADEENLLAQDPTPQEPMTLPKTKHPVFIILAPNVIKQEKFDQQIEANRRETSQVNGDPVAAATTPRDEREPALIKEEIVLEDEEPSPIPRVPQVVEPVDNVPVVPEQEMRALELGEENPKDQMDESMEQALSTVQLAPRENRPELDFELDDGQMGGEVQLQGHVPAAPVQDVEELEDLEDQLAPREDRPEPDFELDEDPVDAPQPTSSSAPEAHQPQEAEAVLEEGGMKTGRNTRPRLYTDLRRVPSQHPYMNGFDYAETVSKEEIARPVERKRRARGEETDAYRAWRMSEESLTSSNNVLRRGIEHQRLRRFFRRLMDPADQAPVVNVKRSLKRTLDERAREEDVPAKHFRGDVSSTSEHQPAAQNNRHSWWCVWIREFLEEN